MISPLLGRVGAVGDVAAEHYGNPLGEQKLLATGQATVDLSHYEVVTVSGPDRLVWLNSLCSQELLGLTPGQSRESLILDPRGHIELQFWITDDGQTSWLLTEPRQSAALIEWLQKMRFRMNVDIADVTKEWAVLATTGAAPESVISWSDPWPEIQPGAVGYGPEPHPGEALNLVYWVIPRSELSEDVATEWAGADALEALQIRAGRPRLEADVDDKTLPHELDWIRTAIHLDKGCYRGQETVAKVHNLGHPPRRFVLLHLDGSGGVLPEPGANVSDGDKVVGLITRVARHYEWGPIAVALIKRTVSVDSELSVEGPDGLIVATQQVLVSPDAGATRRDAVRAARRSP